MTRNTEVLRYPLGEFIPQSLRSASGRPLEEIDIEAMVEGAISAEDVHICAETLSYQAEVARQAGYDRLAVNLDRAAELVEVPDEELLKIYEALRPNRSSDEQLVELAGYLERRYSAVKTAQFIREAAKAYRKIGR